MNIWSQGLSQFIWCQQQDIIYFTLPMEDRHIFCKTVTIINRTPLLFGTEDHRNGPTNKESTLFYLVARLLQKIGKYISCNPAKFCWNSFLGRKYHSQNLNSANVVKINETPIAMFWDIFPIFPSKKFMAGIFTVDIDNSS